MFVVYLGPLELYVLQHLPRINRSVGNHSKECKYLRCAHSVGDSNISTKVGRKYFILFTYLICDDSTGYSYHLPSIS